MDHSSSQGESSSRIEPDTKGSSEEENILWRAQNSRREHHEDVSDDQEGLAEDNEAMAEGNEAIPEHHDDTSLTQAIPRTFPLEDTANMQVYYILYIILKLKWYMYEFFA